MGNCFCGPEGLCRSCQDDVCNEIMHLKKRIAELEKHIIGWSQAYYRWCEFGCGKELRIMNDEFLEQQGGEGDHKL